MIELSARSQETSLRGDKIEAYKWRVKDKKGEQAYVSKHILHVDQENYQREASSDKVLDIAREWSWVACGALNVARRSDGSLWLMDGQYRWMAAMRRSDITDLPCLIFRVASIEEEARGFLDINLNRKIMTFAARFKALKTASDEATLFVSGLLESSGLAVGAGGSSNEVRCLRTIMRWAEQDRQALQRIWPILVDISRGFGPMPIHLVDGLMFIERGLDGGTLTSPPCRNRLMKIGASELVQAAKAAAHFRGKGGSKVWAEGILQRYNKGLQTKLSLAGHEVDE